MSDYSQLILRVVNVLLSDAALKIDFVANGMHVTGAGYRIVWYALTQGWIKLTLSSAAKGAEATLMPPGVAAYYDSGSHSFRFSLLGDDGHWGETDPGERAVILHEATHALRDIMASSAFASDGLYGSNFSQQKLWDNEACAYIAGSLFYFYASPTAKDWYGGSLAKLKELGVPRDSAPSNTADGDVISIANGIAKSIKDKPGAVVDQQDFLNLRAAVVISPTNQDNARRNLGDADARGGAI